MYQIGELVQYGISGVCKVEEIVQDVPGLKKDTEYYLLVPVSKKEEKIYTPVESGKVKMRRILSSEEVKELMGKASDIEKLTIVNEKQCEVLYREELYSVDCCRWISLLKTLYARKAARLAAGKKITATDERYLKNVEERLLEELSLVIGQAEAVTELGKLSDSVKQINLDM